MKYKFITLKNNKYSFIYLCFLLFFWTHCCLAQNTENTIPFVDAISEIETVFDVKFSYNSDTAKRCRVFKPNTNHTLNQTLKMFSEKENINFTFVSNRYITVTFPKKMVSFCATFIDIQTAKPLAITAISENKTYTANSGGILNINSIADTQELELYFEGQFIKPLVIYKAIASTKGNCPLIFINLGYINTLPTITLSSYIAKGIEKTKKGAIVITNNDFEILPSLTEPDVLQIAQVLPGIQSYDETASNINIRAGGSDEVTILWNDIRMYQTGHFFGLISALNPNLIDNVIIYKNGTHPRYSEGVSGVVHIYPTNTIDPEIEGGVGINLASTNAFIKIPVTNSFAIVGSGRTSINNGLGNPIYKSFFKRTFQNTEVTNLNNTQEETLRTTDEDFNFFDISLSALWDISPKDKLNYHFMTISNGLEFNERLFTGGISTASFNELEQNTLLSGFNYLRNWNQKLTTGVHYSNSTYKANSQNTQVEQASQKLQKNQVKEQSLKFDTSYVINDDFSIEAGYQHTSTLIENLETPENTTPIPNSATKGITNGVYVQTTAQLFDDNTTLTLGVRATNLSNFDMQIEPRITLSQRIKKYWSVFISGEKKHQNVLQFTANENQLLGIQNKQWILADGIQNPLLKSTQASFGTDYTQKNWTLNAEVFYKKVAGINTRNLGFRNQFQDTQAIGNYSSQGLEVAIGKKQKNFTTWLSYTYINSNYEFKTLSPRRFPNNFNVTHCVNAIATYTFKEVTISAGANYHSGLPFTTPSNQNAIINTINGPQIQYNSPNNQTLKEYFRTNISAVYKTPLDDTFDAVINLSLLNLFDTKNELGRYYQIQTSPQGENYINTVTQYSLGFTPNISLQLLF